MSPSLASSATNAGSFFSSSLWKRVFSRQRMSPSFMAATAFAAGSPMQSSAKATCFLITCDRASATGLSESLASRPLGRPKCASKIPLPPLPEISVIVGATRSRRVVSVTRPLSVGTLRSTRSSTRLPLTSTSSRVRNGFIDSLTRRKLEFGERGLPEEVAATGVIGRRAVRFFRDLHSLPEAVHDHADQQDRARYSDPVRKVHGAVPYSSLLIATAVSAMRLEKPHSLSYQDITRTKLPFCTLVWSMWNVDECGSWLKSIETLGWVV